MPSGMNCPAAQRGRVVTIQASALETITIEVFGSAPDLETGGILLGHAATSSVDLHVTVAGDPGPQALHEPRRFLRDPAHAQTLADEAWADHRAMWIGEWHTHPVTGPMPSDIDLRSYLQHLKDPELRFPEFLSLIVANASSGPALAAWVITDTHLIEASLSVTGDSRIGDQPGQPSPVRPLRDWRPPAQGRRDERADRRVNDEETP